MDQNLNPTPNLNPQQKEAVSHKEGPLLIVAGAGSGKTKTITSRLMELISLGVSPQEIIAITFTNKAAKEMANRIGPQQSQPFIGTFHSFGARILRHEAWHTGRTPNFVIFDEDDTKKIARKVVMKFSSLREKWSGSKLLWEFSKFKGQTEALDDFWNRDEEGLALRVAFSTYESALKNNNAFDFDDLIQKVVWIFKNKPDILNKYQEKYRYILVDEYQDTNPSQYKLVNLLASKYRNICVVGDDQQSIYAFRGSDFRIFLNFEKDYPESKIVLLEENYRSTGNIIKAASNLISNNRFQKPKKLWTREKAGAMIKVVETTEAIEEAEWVGDEIQSSIRQLADKNQNKETAILYRTNAQSRAIEQALIEREIHYEIFGGLKFYERREIKDVIAGTRFVVNPNDEVSHERVEKAFGKRVGKILIPKLKGFNPPASGGNTVEILGFFLKESDYFEYLKINFPNFVEREENVKALLEFALSFPNPTEFLEKISLLQATDPIDKKPRIKKDERGVVLSTIHLAKGLEFDKVFIIGCNEGLLPHQFSYDKAENLEEERRLMYVAMTRAKKELNLSFYNYGSRFLYEIPPELISYVSLKNNSNNRNYKKSFYDRDGDEIYID